MATASYVIELEILTNSHEQNVLDTKLNVGRHIYNACLSEARKRLRAVLADKDYRALIPNKKAKDRNQRLKEIERAYRYSEYQLHEWSVQCKRHFEGHLGINEVQKLATRAFHAMERVHYRQAKRVYFKSQNDDITIENKTNNTGLRIKNKQVMWGKLKLGLKLKANDEYAHLALDDKTKFVRILKREIRGKWRYFAQLVQEGFPPTKRNRNIPNNHNRVGLDIGTSTIAIVSSKHVGFQELAPDIHSDAKELRRIERLMDRSRRTTNPNNFHSNGTIKRGCKWKFSNHYKKLRAERKDLHRKVASKRKQAHETLSNHILTLGSDIRVETMRFQSLQRKAKKTTRNKKNGKINTKKRFGRSITHRAPAMLVTMIERKLGYQERSIKKIDTYETKASQFNHITGDYTKKQLSERWNDFGGFRIQRDLYSAFLIGNTTDNLDAIDIDLCNDGWDNFVKMHNNKMEDLKQSSSKTMRWFVA